MSTDNAIAGARKHPTLTRFAMGFALAAAVSTAFATEAMAIPAFPSANNSCDAGDVCVWRDWSSGAPSGPMGDTPNAVSNYNNVGYGGRRLVRTMRHRGL